MRFYNDGIGVSGYNLRLSNVPKNLERTAYWMLYGICLSFDPVAAAQASVSLFERAFIATGQIFKFFTQYAPLRILLMRSSYEKVLTHLKELKNTASNTTILDIIRTYCSEVINQNEKYEPIREASLNFLGTLSDSEVKNIDSRMNEHVFMTCAAGGCHRFNYFIEMDNNTREISFFIPASQIHLKNYHDLIFRYDFPDFTDVAERFSRHTNRCAISAGRRYDLKNERSLFDPTLLNLFNQSLPTYFREGPFDVADYSHCERVVRSMRVENHFMNFKRWSSERINHQEEQFGYFYYLKNHSLYQLPELEDRITQTVPIDVRFGLHVGDGVAYADPEIPTGLVHNMTSTFSDCLNRFEAGVPYGREDYAFITQLTLFMIFAGLITITATLYAVDYSYRYFRLHHDTPISDVIKIWFVALWVKAKAVYVEYYSDVNQKRLDEIKYDGDVPVEYRCGIGLVVMDDPVSIPGEAASYERRTLLRWLEENGKSPLTRRHPVFAEDLISQDALREEIKNWVAEKEEVKRGAQRWFGLS